MSDQTARGRAAVAEADTWGVRRPCGDVEPAGILGENRARMLAAQTGGEVVRIDPATGDVSG